MVRDVPTEHPRFIDAVAYAHARRWTQVHTNLSRHILSRRNKSTLDNTHRYTCRPCCGSKMCHGPESCRRPTRRRRSRRAEHSSLRPCRAHARGATRPRTCCCYANSTRIPPYPPSCYPAFHPHTPRSDPRQSRPPATRRAPTPPVRACRRAVSGSVAASVRRRARSRRHPPPRVHHSKTSPLGHAENHHHLLLFSRLATSRLHRPRYRSHCHPHRLELLESVFAIWSCLPRRPISSTWVSARA
mmetsp:Transcript_97677/g.279360  ORF Transcript_97677/g.279360 Transcript_97677/m.279360 type:complete len:244 (-) Transcript_97677:100-831(-)